MALPWKLLVIAVRTEHDLADAPMFPERSMDSTGLIRRSGPTRNAHGEAEAKKGARMNSQRDQRTVLLLLAGGGAVYAAFEHPSLGTALMVGIGVVTLLHLLMGNR